MADPRPPQSVARMVALPLALLLLWKAWWLRYPDLTWSYPFVSWDGYQWILEGLRLRGCEVTSWGRNPGFPAIIALLDAASALEWLPLLQVCLLALFLYLCFRLAALHASPVAAALATFIIGFSYSTHVFFDFVLADPWAITFLAGALFVLETAPDRPVRLLLASALAALSFLCQYAIAFALPALAFFVWRRMLSRPRTREKWRIALLAALLGVGLVLPIFIQKWRQHGDPLWSEVVQFSLVRPHLFGLPNYLVGALAFLGIPAALAAAVGLVSSLRNLDRRLLPLLVLLCMGAFWVLFYLWLDARFLLYLLPPASVFLALGLDRLGVSAALLSPDRPVRRLAAACFLGFALLYAGHPRPNPFNFSWLPLTPRSMLVFGNREVAGWPENRGIDWSERPWIQQVQGLRPAALGFWSDHWLGARADSVGRIDPVARDLRVFRRIAESRLGPGYRISSCSREPLEPIARWKREITLRRSLLECGAPADFSLIEGLVSAGADVVASGSRLVLARPAR